MDDIPTAKMIWDRASGSYHPDGHNYGPTGEAFLKGPVPLAWLQDAAALPGVALAVGVALWHLAGVRKSREHLVLSSERLVPFGVSRYAKDRALRNLVEAGLVQVERRKGRSPRVTLLNHRTRRRRG
jgi:hypothetical protein